MIVTLLGVRGSRPISVMEMLRYGGNTTSFKVELHGMPPIYIDGGTGLYDEGVRMMVDGVPEKIYFMITHTHWDHILSFPYFGPLYEKGCHVIFHAPFSKKHNFENLIRGQHFPLAFPVPFDALQAKQSFVDVYPGDSFELDRAKVSTMQLNHPGTTLGWRVEGDQRTMVVLTDNAPIGDNFLGEGMAEAAAADPKAFEADFNARLVEFLRDADLVIFDTHFDEENIVNRRHWGHSTPAMAIDFCIKAGVRRLILHHHAPEDSDKAIESKAERAWQEVKENNLQVEAGSEGMKIWL